MYAAALATAAFASAGSPEPVDLVLPAVPARDAHDLEPRGPAQGPRRGGDLPRELARRNEDQDARGREEEGGGARRGRGFLGALAAAVDAAVVAVVLAVVVVVPASILLALHHHLGRGRQQVSQRLPCPRRCDDQQVPVSLLLPLALLIPSFPFLLSLLGRQRPRARLHLRGSLEPAGRGQHPQRERERGEIEGAVDRRVGGERGGGGGGGRSTRKVDTGAGREARRSGGGGSDGGSRGRGARSGAASPAGRRRRLHFRPSVLFTVPLALARGFAASIGASPSAFPLEEHPSLGRAALEQPRRRRRGALGLPRRRRSARVVDLRAALAVVVVGAPRDVVVEDLREGGRVCEEG